MLIIAIHVAIFIVKKGHSHFEYEGFYYS